MFIQENNTLVIRHAGSLDGFSARWVLSNIFHIIDQLNKCYLEQILGVKWS